MALRTSFWFTFQGSLCSHYFWNFERNGPKPKWTQMFQTILRNVWLLVILEFCLLSVVCNASAAYISLCKDIKYLLKIPYIIQNSPNMAGFFIFSTLCLGKWKTFPYVQKNIIKMNGICVWYHISLPSFHRICVSLIHTF